MGDITRSNYPELDKVLWDFHNQKIPAQLAFQMYEKRWKFIDEKHMEQKERRLLAQLIDEYGNGIFMAA
ncbi:hypothetical protein [Pantoea sp.]|uniref:hypothetical protein n=1 Tax=Pantoea sp. TaxID=69393 RepID=UPI0031D7256E